MGGIGVEFLTFLLALILFGITLAAVPFTVRISYLRAGSDDSANVQLSGFLGLLKYKVEIPMLDWGENFIPRLRLQTSQHDQKTVTKEVMPKSFNHKFLHKILKHFFTLLRKLQGVRRWFYKGVRCTKLRCVFAVGLKDAAHTGLAVGAAWSMLGYYLGKLHNNITFQVSSPQVAVNPSFRQPKFEVDIDCIFKVRIGHIIFAGFKLLSIVKLELKGGKGK